MLKIPLPARYRGRDLDRATQSILQYDQLDDWVPDAIYHKDVEADRPAFVKNVGDGLASGSLECDDGQTLDIHAGGRRKFSACVAPLTARVVLADVVSQHAPAMQLKLLGDYVFGYKYQSANQAYNRKWFVDVFGAGSGQPNQPVPCSNATPTEDLALPKGWNASYESTAPLSMFMAGGDGLYECLKNVGDYLTGGTSPHRSAQWFDLQSFYSNINKAGLWKVLQQCGADAETTKFIDGILTALGAARATELASLDDTVAFLANFYLKPVDDALGRRRWRRYGDEYFLLGQGSTLQQQIDDSVKVLRSAAQAIGLQISADRAAAITVGPRDMERLQNVGGSCTFGYSTLNLDAFQLYVTAQGTALSDLTFGYVVSSGVWVDSLESVLRMRAGSSPLNKTFHLLRTINLARKDSALWIQGRRQPSERGQQYRNTLAKQAWLLDRLCSRLDEASADKLYWHQLWLLRLASDVAQATPPLRARVSAALKSTNPLVQAHAALTYAKIATEAELRVVAASFRPSGDRFRDRFLAAAAAVAGARIHEDLLTTRFSTMDRGFLNYLRSTTGA